VIDVTGVIESDHSRQRPPGRILMHVVTSTGLHAHERTPEPAEVTTPGPAVPSPRRALKLVVTLRPNGNAGYVAVLALGAEGCDPLLRVAPVDDFLAALEDVPALLAEAEARWQVTPRYPTVPDGRHRPTEAVRATPASAPRAASQNEQSSPRDVPLPDRADRPGQLPLL